MQEKKLDVFDDVDAMAVARSGFLLMCSSTCLSRAVSRAYFWLTGLVSAKEFSSQTVAICRELLGAIETRLAASSFKR